MLSSSLAFMSLLSDEVAMKENSGAGIRPGKDAKEEDCVPKRDTEARGKDQHQLQLLLWASSSYC